MDILVKPVCTRRDLRKFIHLPAKIHKEPSELDPSPLFRRVGVFQFEEEQSLLNTAM